MAQKEASVAELTKHFEDSTAVLLTEYRGLTVAQLKELRNSIRQDAEYAVVKNTLTKIAANNAGISSLDDDLKGPSAVAFVHGDFVATAKALRDFAKANPLLVIKAGIFEGNALTADEVNKYASLESREVLLAKLAGAMKASMTKAAYVFNALCTAGAGDRQSRQGTGDQVGRQRRTGRDRGGRRWWCRCCGRSRRADRV